MRTATLPAVTSPEDSQWSSSRKQLEGGRLKWERTKEVKEVQPRTTGLLSGCREVARLRSHSRAPSMTKEKEKRQEKDSFE